MAALFILGSLVILGLAGWYLFGKTLAAYFTRPAELPATTDLDLELSLALERGQKVRLEAALREIRETVKSDKTASARATRAIIRKVLGPE